MPTIPTIVAFAFAAVASFISNILRGDGLPVRLNAIMAAAAFLILTAVCMWLIHGFSGNLQDDTVYFIGLAVALAGKELLDLVRIAYSVRSPLEPKTAVSEYDTSVIPVVKRASRDQT